jgi:hypothetical protein
VFVTTHINHPLLLAGALLVFLSLLTILFLFSLDYRNISREKFDVSLVEFLKVKKERLLIWQSTPVLHTVIFAIFSIGLLMMILGNTQLVNRLRSTINILIYVGLNVAILAISWFIGEYKKRKRYRQQHKPLISDISMLIDALTNGKDIR